MLKKVPLDTSKDLVPIAAFSTGVSPMVVKKDLPVKNFKELLALSASGRCRWATTASARAGRS